MSFFVRAEIYFFTFSNKEFNSHGTSTSARELKNRFLQNRIRQLLLIGSEAVVDIFENWK